MRASGSSFRVPRSENHRLLGTGGVSISRGRGSISRAYGTQKSALVPEGRIGGAAWQSALAAFACSSSSLHRPRIQTERHVPVRDVVMLLLRIGRPRTLEHASRTAPLVAHSRTASRAGDELVQGQLGLVDIREDSCQSVSCFLRADRLDDGSFFLRHVLNASTERGACRRSCPHRLG
jgi:hypothetical protein